ncbi:MAG: type II toxin-antitoxin system HicB family antitoxin [Betaproteobacteria bacterium]|nr:type II toxin-antitoxin system HicB family antitoxin [Betaproteobacteria bacterium]
MSNTMKYKGYTASMTFDTDDKVIVGQVQEISDVIVFHGKSVAEFEKNFHGAVEAYLSACAKLKDKPEKLASGKLMLRIAPKVHAAALKAASRSGISLNKWAEKALDTAAH